MVIVSYIEALAANRFFKSMDSLNKALALLVVILCISQGVFGQNDPAIIGHWVAVRIKCNIKGEYTEPKDTLMFDGTDFEERIIVRDQDTDSTLFWTQKGCYETRNGNLILSKRVTSTGNPNVNYPDMVFKYKIKNGQLRLGQKAELFDDQVFWVWTIFKRM